MDGLLCNLYSAGWVVLGGLADGHCSLRKRKAMMGSRVLTFLAGRSCWELIFLRRARQRLTFAWRTRLHCGTGRRVKPTGFSSVLKERRILCRKTSHVAIMVSGPLAHTTGVGDFFAKSKRGGLQRRAFLCPTYTIGTKFRSFCRRRKIF